MHANNHRTSTWLKFDIAFLHSEEPFLRMLARKFYGVLVILLNISYVDFRKYRAY